MIFKSKSIYLLIEGGKALTVFHDFEAQLDATVENNRKIAEELGVTSGSKHNHALHGVVFPKEVHPDFTKPHRKSKLSYPKKGTEWEKRFKANPGVSESTIIANDLGVPCSISYKNEKGNGTSMIGSPFNPCGFLSLGDGIHCMYIPDVESRVASYINDGYEVEEPAKSFKPEIDGCRLITEEQWKVMVAQREAGQPVVVPGKELLAFQQRVQPWMKACFTEDIIMDPVERNHRFFEESAELCQSRGMTAEEAHNLVDMVFNRPVGEPEQEVGGVMVTLAALCNQHGIDFMKCGETELARIWNNIEKIRAKQAAKPNFHPEKKPTL